MGTYAFRRGFRTFALLIVFVLRAQAALAAESTMGSIVFRGLIDRIDPEWYGNTSGKSYAVWASDAQTSYARITYSGSTGHDYGLNYKLADRDRYDLYLKMWARQTGDLSRGPKHLKIFGQGIPTTYSNTTFGLASYGKEYSVYYGDRNVNPGGNDNTVEWRFTGVTWQGSALSRPAPTVVTKMSTPTGPIIDDQWHEWGYYIKFNDDGQKNGEMIILLDGVEVFHLKDMYNRGDGHPPLDSFGVGQYFNGGANFTRDYRDIRLSYDGFPPSSDLAGNLIGVQNPPAPPQLDVQ